MAKKSNVSNEENIIDKEKVMQEIKKEVKVSLLEDLEKQVDGLIQTKIEKIEKRINKQKQRQLFKKNVIIILLLGVVLFEGKILYDNGLLNNSNYDRKDSIITDNTKTDVTKDNLEEDIKDIEVYIEKYGYLIDRVSTNLSEENQLYLYDDYKVKDIDNKIRLNIAYQLLDNKSIVTKDGFLTLESSTLKEAYRKVFGSKLEYKNENFINDCVHFIYNESLDKYLAVELECRVNSRKVKQEIIDIEEDKEKLYITTILGVYDNNENIISNLDGSFERKYKENISEYKEELNKFRYEFIKEEDDFYFVGIERF